MITVSVWRAAKILQDVRHEKPQEANTPLSTRLTRTRHHKSSVGM